MRNMPLWMVRRILFKLCACVHAAAAAAGGSMLKAAVTGLSTLG